jgi:hypothetical protein
MGPTASLDVIAISQVIEINREGADGLGDNRTESWRW